MLRSKNVLKIIVTFAFSVLMLTGCAPTIQLQVERPPTLNTAGIRRIAVMDFEAAGGNRAVAQHATNVTRSRIQQLPNFQLVDHHTIMQMDRRGQNIESHVDAILTGRVTRTASERSVQQRSRKNREGQTVNYNVYITDAEVEFSYQLVRARDASIEGPVNRRGGMQAFSESGYEPAEPLWLRIVEHQLATINRDLAPHTVWERRRFATDNNPAVKDAMKAAVAQVRSGNHRQALNAYLAIYNQHQSAAAAVNASILYEVFGEFQAAAEILQRAVNDTGNPIARDAHARIARVMQDRAIVATAYSADAPQNAAERVAIFASEQIRNVLSPSANIWFYNNSQRNAMVEAVVDNLTADFTRNGVRVVDRQNAALIEAEQNLQMSGVVNDDDIMRIGNLSGANTIVIIGITGTGAMRRLSVRVLDIERSEIIFQSDTGENWQI